MNDELWMKRPCDHGETGLHQISWTELGKRPRQAGTGQYCDAGSEERLGPEMVLTNVHVLQDVSTVADVRIQWVLDALRSHRD